MGLHSRPRGKELIWALRVLGEALGYFVLTEYPVRADTDTPPAVDVAWFVDDTRQFPIMIFEVESGASNAAPYNAMKVLGTPRVVFEKPLFFFHLVLGSASDSSRVKVLAEQYGSLNYRIYLECRHELTDLVLDALSQHRRIHDDVDVPALVLALAVPAWREGVDQTRVLQHCERLELRRSLLSDYALLGLNGHAVARERYVQLLLSTYRAQGVPGRGAVGYAGYIGRSWPYPIHLGILATCTDEDPSRLLALLEDWQAHSSYMSQIGPHFGLSQDYDHFIVGVAPTFLAMLVGLFRRVPSSASYLLGVLDALVPKDAAPRRHDIVLFHAMWKAHVAVAAGSESAFEDAMGAIRAAHIAPDLVLLPPAHLDLDRPEDVAAWTTSDPPHYPRFQELAGAVRARLALLVDGDPLKLALASLVSEDLPKHWSTDIVWLLHGPGLEASTALA